ncbi:H3/H4 histone acetyltransferase [Trichosporon asahii var. asahii CBS 2479]|uniref:H3/H4 histone acetyltransferase n=1 Tax=Trichosporon asahii var. asahii (strain ATCC 90039 / CBS 2479 / JCM 2466 / KCTC 7840 / NBRC 103889/ NCYC 2677 / UAMH 7654) TaxID=1186058 RepID=J4UHM7_TRIAS|nr:H3/H4 histone acetyltransferase [Trichosporon asahii var. asahii CBS 2479]EJT51095.1 H3/H4 histone acetyltransferase [Trichosporon asahii var. asahii CBS 2479]
MASNDDPIEVTDELSAAEENQVINEPRPRTNKQHALPLRHRHHPCLDVAESDMPVAAGHGEDEDYTVHRMILGTHTSGQADDHLMIAEVHLPKDGIEGRDIGELYDEERQARIRVKQTINHKGEVNRARYMPQNPDLIATKTVDGPVFIFDRTKHETKAPVGGACKPDITLVGQSKEGASEDTTVAHWDIQQYKKDGNGIPPLRKYTGHSAYVGDVDWHPEHDYIWDTRSENSAKPASQVEGHTAEVNAVAFAPSSPYLLLTGSSDKTVALWDIRKISLKLHSFEGHTDDVLQVAWSPHSPVHFASAAGDRRVNIWNLDAIGAEQTPDDAEDGPPELMFVHGGHTAKVNDISWSPMAKWHIATTAEDNILQVWEPSRHIRAAAEADVNAMDLE